jgi:anti-sigma regulatory factor (Ser/Thr protein kinase)
MTLELHATCHEVMRAVEALQDFSQKKGVPEKSIFGLALVLEECGSNIVNHALNSDAQQTFQVTFEHTGDAFVIELRDRGPAFDPTVADERKPRAEDEDLPGGWGIQLVRRYTDRIEYRREDGENILRLIARLTPAAGSDSPDRSDPNPKPKTHR